MNNFHFDNNFEKMKVFFPDSGIQVGDPIAVASTVTSNQ